MLKECVFSTCFCIHVFSVLGKGGVSAERNVTQEGSREQT